MAKGIIQLTDAAKDYLAKVGDPNVSLTVKGGGCSGFQYILEPCNKKPNKLDEIIDMKDYKVKISNEYLFKLINTEIDYTNDIMGNRFVFTNPNSDFQCGCGKSFS